ncbi:hypothetical protein, partial [Mycoplasmopsis arginini]|uniref:hypothetical protein n=1 Tax=Mycoplasmopsis arginini TaxID=2094 RepID=UPI00249EE05A
KVVFFNFTNRNLLLINKGFVVYFPSFFIFSNLIIYIYIYWIKIVKKTYFLVEFYIFVFFYYCFFK